MTRAPRSPDIAVIGGGVVGSAVAAFLAEAGLAVRLYERSAIAAGASGRNSGIVQHPFDPVLAALYRATISEYRELADGSPSSFALPARPAGLMFVGRDGALAIRVASEWATAWPETGAEVVEGSALQRLEPGLAPDVVACRLEVGYPVAPAAATVALADHARRLGVEVSVGAEARPAFDGDRAVGVRVDGTVEPAGAVVVAAGPWTPELVDPSGSWRPIESNWGVVASVALPAGTPRHALEAIEVEIEPGGAGGAGSDSEPRDDAVDFSLMPGDGASALGSTFLSVETDPLAWLDPLRRVGARYVPAVATAPLVGMRQCARPLSRDGRPLIGRARWCEGLWVAAGHGPWGISTGPGSARLLANRILGRVGNEAIPPELAVGRFGAPGQRQD